MVPEAHMASPPIEIACRILEFCDWDIRIIKAPQINRHWSQLLKDDSVWRSCCQLLHAENFVYCPPVIPFTSWRECFVHIWPIRTRWRGELKQMEPQAFSINVVARFRPLPSSAAATAATQQKKNEEIVLPLHQQLQLMQQAGLSLAEARVRLFGPQTDFFANATLTDDGRPVSPPPVDDLPLNADAPEEYEDDLPEEESKGGKIQQRELGVVSVMPNAAIMCAPGVGIRRFDCFDYVFDSASMQGMVYEKTARREVFEFINGINCTVMLYGQTGSGKTYTLFGPDGDASTSLNVSGASGIVPRVCDEVMEAIAARTEFGVQCNLNVSYVEVYGDQVTDLLRSNVAGQWQGTAARAVIEGSVSQHVDTRGDLERLLRLGEYNKRKAATAMNERSTRAHVLLFLILDQVVQSPVGKAIHIRSTLCLADLGGCEQLKKSGASGERLKEAIHINMGLLALKQCITRLNMHERTAVIPYNDSRLTQLLRSGLGGDAKTTVIVTCSMEPGNAIETIQALRFGEKCAVVQNMGGQRISTIADQIAALDAEIAACRAEIKRKERWVDAPAENKAEFELEGVKVTKSVVVGGEAEGERLAKLLEWRTQLLGDNIVAKGQVKIRKVRPFKPTEWKV